MKITFCEKEDISHVVKESHFWVVQFEKRSALRLIWDLTTSLHFWTTTLFLWWKSLNSMFSWLFFFLVPFLLFHVKMKFHLSGRNKPALSSFKILVIICYCDHSGYHGSAQKPRLLEQCKIHVNLHSPLFP